MSTNTNPNENKQEVNEARIDIEPIPFDGMLKSKFTSTMDLSKIVNSVFMNALADYEGCIILPSANGSFECTLYFKDKPIASSEQIKNLAPVGIASKGSKGFDRLEAINNRTSNKMYTLTEETKQILSKFMHSPKPNQKINWNQCIFEQADHSQLGHIIYVKVVGIDLIKIIKAVYGGSIDGDRCDYNISMVRAAGPNNFLVSIQQLDTKEVEALAQKVGMLQSVGSIMMVRG